MDQVRIAVIGTGWMARQHMEKIADFEHARVGAVSDINQGVVDQLAKQYDCPGYTDHKQLLADGVADAVLIATPHFFHTSIGRGTPSSPPAPLCLPTPPPTDDRVDVVLNRANQPSRCGVADPNSGNRHARCSRRGQHDGCM